MSKTLIAEICKVMMDRKGDLICTVDSSQCPKLDGVRGSFRCDCLVDGEQYH